MCCVFAGNDLSRSFHWGPEFEHGWIKGHASVYSTLERVSAVSGAELNMTLLTVLLAFPSEAGAVDKLAVEPHSDALCPCHRWQTPR